MITLEFDLPYRYDFSSSGNIVPVGSFSAFGHELTLRTQGLEWSAMVFFYAASDPQANFLGRRGWLDRVRLGLTHYEQSRYLEPFDR